MALGKAIGKLGQVLIWLLLVVALFALEEWLRKPRVIRGDITSIEKHFVQQLRNAAINKKLGSVALVLVQGGRIASEHGFGTGNEITKAAVNTKETLFLLSSVSKAVTAWGIMKLVQDGKLKLDEPILPYLERWKFPGSEAYRDKITVRQLLSHTAGIDDGFGYSGFLPSEKLQTLEESLNHPMDANMGEPHATKIVREPGTAMSYSSAGYAVLQLLVEEITHKAFNTYMQESILHPLGMTRSGFDLDKINAEGRTNQLAPNYDVDLKPQPHRRYANMAGVSLRSTAHDMALLLCAYSNINPVLRKESIKQMLEPQPRTSGSWGLGHELFAENNADGYIVGHGGGAFPRTGASFRINPATGNGVAIFMTGGTEMIDPYIDDWIYWETGKKPFDIRHVLHTRWIHTLVLIVLGTIIILTRKKKA